MDPLIPPLVPSANLQIDIDAALLNPDEMPQDMDVNLDIMENSVPISQIEGRLPATSCSIQTATVAGGTTIRSTQQVYILVQTANEPVLLHVDNKIEQVPRRIRGVKSDCS